MPASRSELEFGARLASSSLPKRTRLRLWWAIERRIEFQPNAGSSLLRPAAPAAAPVASVTAARFLRAGGGGAASDDDTEASESEPYSARPIILGAENFNLTHRSLNLAVAIIDLCGRMMMMISYWACALGLACSLGVFFFFSRCAPRRRALLAWRALWTQRVLSTRPVRHALTMRARCGVLSRRTLGSSPASVCTTSAPPLR